MPNLHSTRVKIRSSVPADEDFVGAGPLRLSFADIRGVVDEFYARVRLDPLLSVPFSSVHDWPYHLDRLTHFWWLRFGGRPYLAETYDPVTKHFEAGFNQVFLKQWLSLFHEVLKEKLTEDQAQNWMELSSRMGTALSHKNELYRQMAAGR
jgi:hemoglobin